MAKKLTKAQIDDINLQYLPRLTVKNADEYLQKSAARSARVRKKLACRIDVPYGDTSGQMLDIFPAAREGAPVHVFIHGGYWRALDKQPYAFSTQPLVAAGALVASINYTLCPAVTLDEIVRQSRAACAWVWRNAAALHQGIGALGYSLCADLGPIIAVRFDDTEQAFGAWRRLLDDGVYTNLAIPPGTPNGISMLRCSVSAAHSDTQVQAIIDAFSRLAGDLGLGESLQKTAEAVAAPAE